jgi:hypothetical protein
MNITDRIDRILGEPKSLYVPNPDQSVADLIMGMVPHARDLDFSVPRVVTAIKSTTTDYRDAVFKKLKQTPDHPIWSLDSMSIGHLFARMSNIADEMVMLADQIGRIRPPRGDEGWTEQYREEYYQRHVGQIRGWANDLAKEINPTGLILHGLKRGEDIDWL